MLRAELTAATEPVLYSFRRCLYAMRARLALSVSNTSCEMREVSLANKSPEMLAVSPKGTVPVLCLPDRNVIDESFDIMRWALAIRDPEGRLERDNPELIAANDGPFKQDLDRYKYPVRQGSDPTAHHGNGLAFVRQPDDRLAHAGQLCGSARGPADAAIVPLIRQFAAVNREWFDAQPLAHVQRWLAGHLASDLFGAITVQVGSVIGGIVSDRVVALPLALMKRAGAHAD